MIDLTNAHVQRSLAWATADEAPAMGGLSHCETRDVFNARLERLRSRQKEVMAGERADLVSAVVAEIGGNSFDHNLGQWRDLPGVYLDDLTTADYGIIILADRGQGVRATLQRAVTGTLASDEDALRLAFLRRITGRVGERWGNGLKFVREVVRDHGMDLYFQSGRGTYEATSGDESWKDAESVVLGCIAVVSFALR
jgi:hypothetical protein